MMCAGVCVGRLWDPRMRVRVRMAMRVLAVALAWLACVTVATTGAHAQTSARDADARARELYQLGDEFYANGRYEAAEEAFAEAHRLSGRPLLLFNLANAQERSGRWELAVQNLRLYRESAPSSEHASLDARIRALERRIDERDAEARDEPVVVVQHESPEMAAEDAPVAGEAPRAPVPPHRVLLPAAGALAATTLVLALRVRSVRNDAESACLVSGGERLCAPSAEAALDRDRRLSLATDFVGLATLVSAALGAWQMVRYRQREPESSLPQLEVSASRRGASLQLRGGF